MAASYWNLLVVGEFKAQEGETTKLQAASRFLMPVTKRKNIACMSNVKRNSYLDAAELTSALELFPKRPYKIQIL